MKAELQGMMNTPIRQTSTAERKAGPAGVAEPGIGRAGGMEHDAGGGGESRRGRVSHWGLRGLQTDPEGGKDSPPLHFSPSLPFLRSFSGFCWQNFKDTKSYIQPWWENR